MFIEPLDKTKFLVTLVRDDLKIFNIAPNEISLNNENTRTLLKQILSLAAVKSGITLKNKILSVELIPFDNGCFMLVSTKPDRKIYKIKKNSSYILVSFDSAAKIFDVFEKIQHIKSFDLKSSVYSKGEMFYLLLYSKVSIPKALKIILSEYGKIYPCDKLTVMQLEESCKTIHTLDSISYFGKIINGTRI